jgi:hypothetical protein
MMTHLQLQTIQPKLIFSAKRKTADTPQALPSAVKKPSEKPTSGSSNIPFPLYYIIRSGGDGSFSPTFFATKSERDKAWDWLEETGDELPCDPDGVVNETDVFKSAKDFIAEQESYNN